MAAIAADIGEAMTPTPAQMTLADSGLSGRIFTLAATSAITG